MPDPLAPDGRSTNPLAPASEGTRRRTVRLDGESVATRERLLAALARTLSFPSYFGGNWDALEECLRDLSWLEPWDELRIEHDSPPLADNPAQAAIYHAILTSAARHWSAHDPPRAVEWNWPGE